MEPFVLVEVTGLEPAASWSQTKHSTKLSYTSYCVFQLHNYIVSDRKSQANCGAVDNKMAL